MQYGGYGFSKNGKPTITYLVNGKDSKIAVSGQRFGASSMDIYQICYLYGCKKCAGVDIDSYENSAHKKYLNKCSDEFDRWFWSSRCLDGIKERVMIN